jgi:NitT/TauT family transport system substrate-binding protein
MNTRRWRGLLLLVTSATLVLVAGCSGVGNAASPPSVEKPNLTVGVVPAVDSAGFFIALYQGLFKDQGLIVTFEPVTSSETAISDQVKKIYDITGGNYVSYIQAVAEKHDPLEVIAEGSVMQQGSQVIFTMPKSNIKTLAGLKGHVLGVNAPQNIDYLLDVSVLSENGVNMNSVTFPSQPIPFPDMAGELSSGKIDAATMPEPFASIAEQQLGAVTLADLNQGATQEFPIEGYVVTKAWAKAHPNTLRRFLAALEQGQEIADTNRAAVEQAFEIIKGGSPDGQVPASIAALIALNTYPIGIDQARLQRVADVMHQFGLLPNRFDVGDMLMPASDFDFAAFSSS